MAGRVCAAFRPEITRVSFIGSLITVHTKAKVVLVKEKAVYEQGIRPISARLSSIDAL